MFVSDDNPHIIRKVGLTRLVIANKFSPLILDIFLRDQTMSKINLFKPLILLSKDMWHMIFENPKIFVDSYICENYSNE